jgi:hypothetical protein
MTNKRKAIINVANNGWYPLGQLRLIDSLVKNGFNDEILRWTNDSYPIGSPSHRDIPYAFKIWAFEEAFNRGNDLVLWLDASMYAIRPLDLVFDEIEKEGHLIFENTHCIGEWCSDRALDTLKITREESFAMPSQLGGIIGLSATNPRSMEFLKQWKQLAIDGVTFHGDWKNDHGQVSSDLRVRGHRHDQTAASVISSRLGMKWQPFNGSFLCFPGYSNETTNSIIVCKGM